MVCGIFPECGKACWYLCPSQRDLAYWDLLACSWTESLRARVSHSATFSNDQHMPSLVISALWSLMWWVPL